MATVHVATPDRQQIQYTEDQFRTYFQQGAFHPECLFWVDGMTEWRPVGEYATGLASVPQPQPIPQAPISQQPQPDQEAPNNQQSQPVEEALSNQQPQPLEEAPSNQQPPTPLVPETPTFQQPQTASVPETPTFQQHPMMQQTPHPFGQQQSTISGTTPYSSPIPFQHSVIRDLTPIVTPFKPTLMVLATLYSITAICLFILAFVGPQLILTLLYIFVFVVSFFANITAWVMFCFWIYRATTNVIGFGATGLAHKPTWAAASNFIPIVNLWMPYQAVSQVYRASCSPQAWQNVPNSPIIRLWWILWLNPILFFVIYVALRLTGISDSIDSNSASHFIQGIMSLAFVGTCLVLHKVVSLVHKAQQQLMTRRV